MDRRRCKDGERWPQVKKCQQPLKLEEAEDERPLVSPDTGGTAHSLILDPQHSQRQSNFCCFKPRSVVICYSGRRKEIQVQKVQHSISMGF